MKSLPYPTSRFCITFRRFGRSLERRTVLSMEALEKVDARVVVLELRWGLLNVDGLPNLEGPFILEGLLRVGLREEVVESSWCGSSVDRNDSITPDGDCGDDDMISL